MASGNSCKEETGTSRPSLALRLRAVDCHAPRRDSSKLGVKTLDLLGPIDMPCLIAEYIDIWFETFPPERDAGGAVTDI